MLRSKLLQRGGEYIHMFKELDGEEHNNPPHSVINKSFITLVIKYLFSLFKAIVPKVS